MTILWGYDGYIVHSVYLWGFVLIEVSALSVYGIYGSMVEVGCMGVST